MHAGSRADRIASMIALLNAFPVAALTQSRTLFELGLVVVLAAAAPLIAQVLRLPSLLVLLALGFGAGAIGALDPNALLGQQLISAVVSVAVGIILFEAGLGLKVSKLTGTVAHVYRRLVSIGILVTWAVGTVTAYLLFDLSWQVALVLGAVLVVSGPTVVGPLLEFIRPSKTVNSVLKWEGTLADPIGATLGVAVFNVVVAGHAKAGRGIAGFFLSIGIGAGFGVAGAVLVLAWVRWFKPNQSQAVPGTLMFVVAMVVGADLLRDDTGLITGLVIGAILVNRPPRGIGPRGMEIQRAKLLSAWRERIGTLSTFLIGMLFIILSARVTPHQIAQIGWVSVAFIAVLVLIGRPLAVALSTLGSKLRWRERAFIAWMAPRGIVAAATSSTFALGLSQAGVGGGAQKLIPITFIVIVATALIYGLSGGPVARALGVASTGPGGVLLVGSTPVGRAIGRALKDRGLTVMLWTGDEDQARAAEADGLTVYPGDPTEDASAGIPSELDGLEYALAVGGDEALNAMIATDLSEHFGRGRVFQLPVTDGRAADFYTRVPVLFDDSATHDELLARIEAGGEIVVAEAPAGTNGETDIRTRLGATGMPMFVLTPGKDLHVLAADDRPPLQAGQELIGLIKRS
ncbi:MAG: cation:proton antiporter [Solirubrobacteraceae bacterium]